MDLPGFKKEDVKLDLQNGYLTITANRTADHDEKDGQGHYIRQERYTGSCARSFYVGDELKPEDVKASFEDGILKLNLPRRKPRSCLRSSPLRSRFCNGTSKRGAIPQGMAPLFAVPGNFTKIFIDIFFAI